MKKLVSILTSLALLTAAASMNVNAADEKNPNLYELAKTLGADTDYFNFPNYNVQEPEKEIMDAFRRNLTQNEVITDFAMRAEKPFKEAGGCSGISILQILTHNGVIPVSAIQEGAETLHDVQFDKSVNDIIAYYQLTQHYIKRSFLASYNFCQTTEEQQLSQLVEMAEKTMKDNRYFYIGFNMNIGSHAMVGIGCVDGNWTFKDRKYNKCVLTIDSNCKNEDCSAGGFTHIGCIYINTDDSTFYIPAYEADETNTRFRDFIDNDALLNYKGLISPTSDEDVPSVENITRFDLSNSSKTRKFKFTTITGDEAKEYTGSYDDFTLSPKKFRLEIPMDKRYYIDSADYYKFDVLSIDEEEYSALCYLTFDTETTHRRVIGSGDFSAEARENFVSITSRTIEKNHTVDLEISSENGLYKNSRFCTYSIWGRCDGTVSMEETADGILIRHDLPLDARIGFIGTTETDAGWLDYYNSDGVNMIGYEVYSTADNLWKYDEEKDDIVCYADPNGDGIFDVEVVNGDVNCDGVIDAKDASKILKIYADLSTNTVILPHIIAKKYADWNGDGSVNASDASGVLAKYAELSTSKS